ncbi:MAG: aminotransferase class IV, partial [Thermoanaerobaculia bacterium]
MKPLCSLNGRILPLAEARIDPQDRGFLFGDSLYEGIKVLHGRILHLDLHLDRLLSGLGRIDITPPEGLELRCRQLVEACGPDTGFLYLQVTRGVGQRSHVPPRDLAPTV